jgi:prophage antirepressor-like protein
MNDLIPFDFENRQTRVIVEGDEAWFVAQDVVRALGHPHSRETAQLCKKVPEEWKGMKRIDTLGGPQNTLCLSEQGLYFFLGRSDKEKALPFQKKVAGEILPQIRKTGAYVPAGSAVTLDSKVLTELNDLLGAAARRIRVLETERDHLLERERLQRQIKRLETRLAKKNTRLTDMEKEEVKLLAGNAPARRIALMLDRSASTVRRVLKEARIAAARGKGAETDDEPGESFGGPLEGPRGHERGGI